MKEGDNIIDKEEGRKREREQIDKNIINIID